MVLLLFLPDPIFIAKDETVLSKTTDLGHAMEKDLPRNAGLPRVIGIGDGYT